MKTHWLLAGAALGVGLGLAGCSQRLLYQSVQGWQQQECRRIADHAERQRCLDSSAASYDDYRRQREAAKGQP